MALAVKKDYLDVAKWLYAEYGGAPNMNIFQHEGGLGLLSEGTSVMDTAAKYGHLDILKYLHELGTVGETRLFCTKNAMDTSAANGHLSTVQWLDSNRREGCSSAARDEAAAGGYLEVVKWLHHHRAEGCSTNAMDKAAMPGRNFHKVVDTY